LSILKLKTTIKAPIELSFNLARSVEVHLESTAHTHEKVIGGRTSGLCQAGDVITWRARHFGLFQNLTVEITQMTPFSYFQDRMVKGAFKRFTHDHIFTFENGHTVMEDIFNYSGPYLLLGTIAEYLFLDRYMLDLLEKRNSVIKQLAESRSMLEATSTYYTS
jgi:ligand-binding SRPBCC domain-containing protein